MAHASDGRSMEFKLPDLGEGLTEAEIVRWLVEVGDVVAVDQPVVEVETAKAMVEVPCPYGGVVTARFGEEGTELPVGAPLVTVAVGATAAEGPARASGTDAGSGTGTDEARAAEPPAAEKEPEGSGNVLVGYGTSEAPARRRRVRPERRVATGASGRANGWARDAGQTTGPAVRTAEPVEGPVPVISPLVRRLARQNDMDLRELTGSGPDGLILRADVEYALRAAAAQGGRTADPEAGTSRVPDAASAASSASRSDGTRVPLKGVRGAVADKLSRSRREIPDATCWVDADATGLMRARTAMNASGGPKISLVALLARICTAALARFPELNSTVDTQAREIVRLDGVHIGFAAQTDRGLVVPVVRDAHARDAESLTAEFARLTEAARAGG